VPPSTIGLFYFGSTAIQVPFGNGFRCVGAGATGVFRLGVGTASSGVLTRAVDNTLPPSVGHLTSGSTWNFQAWFRDPAAGGANFNLSDGLRIAFAP
jgi:hypothetical protein